MRRRLIGRHIVADDAICHGKPTFVGTRVMVADVLEMIAQGYDWYSIREKWGGAISKETILEAADIARLAFLEHVDDYLVETISE